MAGCASLKRVVTIAMVGRLQRAGTPQILFYRNFSQQMAVRFLLKGQLTKWYGWLLLFFLLLEPCLRVSVLGWGYVWSFRDKKDNEGGKEIGNSYSQNKWENDMFSKKVRYLKVWFFRVVVCVFLGVFFVCFWGCGWCLYKVQ